MNVNAVNFKSGFLYNNGRYINPDTIKEVRTVITDNKKKETYIKYTDETAEINPLAIDTFVAATIQAKNSEDIVDISKA